MRSLPQDLLQYFISSNKLEISADYKQYLIDLRNYCMNCDNMQLVDIMFNGTKYQIFAGRLLVALSFAKVFTKYEFKIFDETVHQRLIEVTLKILSIQDLEYVNNNTYFKFIYDPIIDLMLDMGFSGEQTSFMLTRVLRDLSNHSIHFNYIAGNTFNLKQIIDLGRSNPKFKECLNYTSNENQQISKIEEDNAAVMKEGMAYLSKVNGSLGNLARSGVAFNAKQLAQVLFTIGFKPDLRGRTINYNVNTSFLRGLRTPQDLVIIARAGRKAEINNYVYVAKGGYLGRKFMLANIDNFLRKDTGFCDTINPQKIFIKNKAILARFDKRFYRKPDGTDGYISIDDEKSNNLVGQFIELYTPVTCNSEDVCARCYGKLHRINKTIHAALYGSTNVGNQVIQGQLATKHLLQTETEEVDDSEFDDFLTINTSDIILNNRSIFIEVLEDNILTDNHHGNYCHIFNIYKNDKFIKTIEVPTRFYFTPESDDAFITGNKVSLSDLDDNGAVFTLVLKTREANRALNDLIQLLEKKDHNGINNINELIQVTAETLDEARFDTNSIHTEMIIRELVVKSDGSNEKLDFSKPIDDYIIRAIPDTIMNGPLAVSLLFEHHKNQFKKIDIFKRNKKSILDPLYFD